MHISLLTGNFTGKCVTFAAAIAGFGARNDRAAGTSRAFPARINRENILKIRELIRESGEFQILWRKPQSF
jgi:hypothetical protein